MIQAPPELTLQHLFHAPTHSVKRLAQFLGIKTDGKRHSELCFLIISNLILWSGDEAPTHPDSPVSKTLSSKWYEDDGVRKMR